MNDWKYTRCIKMSEIDLTNDSHETGVFRRSLISDSNRQAIFTDLSRNKFGVNSEIFIYQEIYFFGLKT